MALILPSDPAPRRMNMRKVSARNELSPAFGGDSLRLNRKGTKYAADIEFPPMTYDRGNAFTDLDAEADTVVIAVRQPDIDTGAPGAANLVKGAGQAGSSLLIDGVTPGYIFGKGWYLTHINAGRRRLYRSAAAAVANGDGEITIPLQTLLRFPPADNDVVLLGRPEIEGYVTGTDMWDVDAEDRLVRISFTITER